MKNSSNYIEASGQTGEIPATSLIKPGISNFNDDLPVFTGGKNYRRFLKEIENREIVVHGSYPTALAFYSWLKKRTLKEYPVHDYLSSRIAKEMTGRLTKKILVPVRDHRIDLDRAPAIPWLMEFYPDTPHFLITLPDLLGMNGAWQWYMNGIQYPVLPYKLHPFYGVYFPTRHEHLILFDQWLGRENNRFESAVDIGTGCGILSFMMARHGIGRIHATDINPNAVYSMLLEGKRFDPGARITIEHSSFFGSLKEVRQLAVFNPPWIPGMWAGITDRGIYYKEGFFKNFFDEAGRILIPGSVLVIIFSTFALEAGISKTHPIEDECAVRGDFRIKERINRNVTERAGRSKNWINMIRAQEKIELWVLKKIR